MQILTKEQRARYAATRKRKWENLSEEKKAAIYIKELQRQRNWSEEQKLSHKEQQGRYREKNRDKIRAASKLRVINKESKKRINERYKERHGERLKQYHLEYGRKYNALYPERGRFTASKRRAAKLRATPSWADLGLIADAYQEATYHGLEVDHIVPLQSKLVCGLHVWDNLQLLTSTENVVKGNRSWPDMP